jgi:hypothetical protein
MPNMMKMEACHARIEEINVAIKEASFFLDKKAFLNTEKGRELLTMEELTTLLNAETSKLWSAGQE